MKDLYKSKHLVSLAALFALFIGVMFSTPGFAEDIDDEGKAFAKHKFVLQISDMDPAKQTLVLNVPVIL